MTEIITNFLGMTPAVFLKVTYELSLLSLFGVCLTHSYITHGWKRTVREFVAGFFLTLCCESTGVLSGAYVYPGFKWYVAAVPVGNPASWIALVYIIIEVTNRLIYGRKAVQTYESDGFKLRPAQFALFRGSFIKTLFVLAIVDATLALCIDIVMDPLATIYNWWIWVPCLPGVTDIGPGVVDAYNFSGETFMTSKPSIIGEYFAGFFPNGMRYPTRVFGIPLINFIAWFVFVFVFSIQFRFVEFKEKWSELKKTIVLWTMIVMDVPILTFALIVPNI